MANGVEILLALGTRIPKRITARQDLNIKIVRTAIKGAKNQKNVLLLKIEGVEADFTYEGTVVKMPESSNWRKIFNRWQVLEIRKVSGIEDDNKRHIILRKRNWFLCSKCLMTSGDITETMESGHPGKLNHWFKCIKCGGTWMIKW